MSINQICKSLSVVEENSQREGTEGLGLDKEKANKAIKGHICRLDYGLWKLVHGNWGVFLGKIRKDDVELCVFELQATMSGAKGAATISCEFKICLRIGNIHASRPNCRRDSA